MDCSLPGSSVLGFPRQEQWTGLPFPSPGDLETNIMLYVIISQLKKKSPDQIPPYPGERACFHRPDVPSTGPSSNSRTGCSPPSSRPPASESPTELIKNTNLWPPCLQGQAFWALLLSVYIADRLPGRFWWSRGLRNHAVYTPWPLLCCISRCLTCIEADERQDVSVWSLSQNTQVLLPVNCMTSDWLLNLSVCLLSNVNGKNYSVYLLSLWWGLNEIKHWE